MTLQAELDIGLKEWDVVCRALAAGRQMMLLRKGGIFESAGGFEIEHRQFLLFPTFLHQKVEMLKDEALKWYERPAAEPEQIKIAHVACITDIIRVQSRTEIDRLDDLHIWTPPLIDMRFGYKPQNPLYLLLVRTYALPAEVLITNSTAYAGCKSWVPLDNSINSRDAVPVLGDAAYSGARQRIIARLAR